MAISTDRLHLEILSENDSSFIFELLNTDGWLKNIGNRNVNSEPEAIAYIQKILENPNIVYWTVRLNGTSVPIGLVTLIKRDYLDFRDIGFAFLPAFSNEGYAYEATKAVLVNVVEEPIFAVTLPENKSSIKLIEKLGLKFEKAIERNNEKLHIYAASISWK